MVENDYKLACDVIDKKIDTRYLTDYFSRLYFFTNENFDGILEYDFDIKNKNLIVGSSADQTLDLICHGAKSITICDLNPFAKYYFYLKKSAIKSLKIEKYLDYFFVNNSNLFFRQNRVFNYNTFKVIANNLDDEAKYFWESLYRRYDSSTIVSNLFMKNLLGKKLVILNNSYLNPENYLLMREKIENADVNFINSEIVDYAKNNPNIKYDYIYISNIFDYMLNILIKTENELEDILPDYISLLRYITNILNDNGTLLFHYFWDSDNNEIYAYIYDSLKKFIDIDNILVEGSHRYTDEVDSVLVYRKNLKQK